MFKSVQNSDCNKYDFKNAFLRITQMFSRDCSFLVKQATVEFEAVNELAQTAA